MAEFISRSSVRRAADGTYTATLLPEWTSIIAIHGGYVAAIAAQTMTEILADDRSLRTLHVQFVRPPQPGDVVIEHEIVSSGRTTTFLRTLVRQEGKAVLAMSVIAAAPRAGLEFDELPRPALAGTTPPPGLERYTGPNPGGHLEQFDFRLEPGLTMYGEHGVARVAGWLRPVGPNETLSIPWMVCAADFMPPSVLFRIGNPVPAASVEMSVHLLDDEPSASVPQGEYIFAEMRSAISSGGFCVEDGTFWSPAGTLLATSRQFRLSGG